MIPPQPLEARLDAFESLVERLDRGDAIRYVDLARSIEALRECATSVEDPTAYTPPTDPAARRLREIYWTLESLERGESGSAGAFVRSAREYVRLNRQRLSTGADL